MNIDEWDVLEPARSKLRVLAARLEQEIERHASAAGSAEPSALTTAWAELSTALDLGEEPELRACPHCRRSVLREATRCRYCMRNSLAGEKAA